MKKIDLIDSINPEWEDLYEKYFSVQSLYEQNG
jgi:hypothetical protein